MCYMNGTIRFSTTNSFGRAVVFAFAFSQSQQTLTPELETFFTNYRITCFAGWEFSWLLPEGM